MAPIQGPPASRMLQLGFCVAGIYAACEPRSIVPIENPPPRPLLTPVPRRPRLLHLPRVSLPDTARRHEVYGHFVCPYGAVWFQHVRRCRMLREYLAQEQHVLTPCRIVALILDCVQDGPLSTLTGNRHPKGYQWMRCLPTFDVMSSGPCDAVSVSKPRTRPSFCMLQP